MSIRKEFTVAFQLASVSRYSRDHSLKPESVLEHIGFCTFYGMLVAGRVEKGTSYKIDYGRLLKSIALHDVDEAVLGDIPRTTKYFSASIREEFKKAESETLKRLDRWLDSSFSESWHAAKTGIEGQILKVVDAAAVVYKNWIEIEMLRNRSFLRVADETQRHLLSFKLDEFIPILAEEITQLQMINHKTLNNIFQMSTEDYIFSNMKE